MKLLLSVLSALLLCACAGRSPAPETAASAAATNTRTEGTLVYDGMPTLDPAIRERLRPYLEARPANFLGWLPNAAGVLISTRFGNTQQLHTVAFAEGARRQITFYDEPVVNAVVSADPQVNGLIFAKDRGGDEYFQLYFQRLDTLQIKTLTNNQARNERPLFARSGTRYAYSSSARNGQGMDIWLGDVASDAPARLLTQEAGTWFALDFSHDGQQLLVQQYISITDSRLHLLDLGSMKLQPLLAKQPVSANPLARFSHDDSGVYYLSDQGEDIILLHYLDRKSGISKVLSPNRNWDVVEFDLGQQDQTIAILENLAGSHRIQVYQRGDRPGTEFAQPIAELALAGGVISSIQFNEFGAEIGFLTAGAQIPGDVLSLNIASKQMTRWTRNETGGLDPDQFIVPTLEYAGGFDTAYMGLPRQIPGLVYKPQRSDPAPVVIMVHGGPESQAQPGFDPFIQFLVRELKYAVITPNVRGSSGFGRRYLELDNGVKRFDSVRDLEAWINWARVEPGFDPDRVVVYGGSYGGFMVLAALANYSDRLAGGVDIVGISNFVSFLENTNPYRQDQRRQEYGDERDPAVRKVLEEISPLNQADRIRKPLFVIQGANDPRVPRSESEQIVKAVRDHGQEVWYLLGMNEGHGFRKRENLDAMRVAVVMWLEKLFQAKAEPKP